MLDKLLDQSQGLSDFEEHDANPGQSVALRLDQDIELQVLVCGVGVVAPAVTVRSGRAPNRTDEVVLRRIVDRQNRGRVQAVDEGCSVLEQTFEPFCVLLPTR